MTREKLDALVKSLDRMGLGTNNGDAVRRLQSMRIDALLMSALPVPLYQIPH